MKRVKRLLVFIFVFAFVFSIIMSSFVFADSKGTDKSKGNSSKDSKVKVEEENTSESITLEEQPAEKTEFAKLAKEEKQRIKAEIRSNYSDGEMKILQEATQEIEENNSDVDVLPVESIVTKGKKVKWDIPPVVKSGRILVPVRALTQAYGATVIWNQEEQKVTITKDGMEIVIELNSKTVLVNGVTVELDVPAQSINSRTVVPLRFIAEQLGLKVNFDDETDTVEIEDEEDEDEEDLDEEDNQDENVAEEATEEDGVSEDDVTGTEDIIDSEDDDSTIDVGDTSDSTTDDNADSQAEDVENDTTQTTP